MASILSRRSASVFAYSVLIAVFSSIGLSCGDSEPIAEPQISVEEEVIDDGVEKPVQVVDGFEIYANPPENPSPHLESMPDGIHLQPGVEVHELQESVVDYVYFDEELMQIIVARPAVQYFDDVKPDHVISAGDAFAFIVEDLSYEGDVLVVDVAPLEFHKVVWGNWRIPFKVDLSKIAQEYEMAKNEVVPAEEEPTTGTDGEPITTHRQASLPREIVNLSIDVKADLDSASDASGRGGAPPSISVDANVAGEVGATGSYRLSATDSDGQFVGRIGSYREEYDCGETGWGAWIRNKFCVDQIGFQLEVQGTREFKAFVKATGKVEALIRKKLLNKVTVATLPLGPTSITVNIELSLIVSAKGELAAAGEVFGKTSSSRTNTYGFLWTRANKAGNGNETTTEVWPKEDATEENSPFELDVAGEAKANITLSVRLQFDFGAGVGANRVKARAAQVAGVLALELDYSPWGLGSSGGNSLSSGEEDCWSAKLVLKGEIKLKMEFEVDLTVFKKKITIFCDDDDPDVANCAAISVSVPLMTWGGADYCIDRSFDTLVIDVQSTDSPVGIDDIDGYDVLAICKQDASGGLDCAQGQPNLEDVPDSCPIDDSNAVGLSSGRHEFQFGSPIEPSDVITVARQPTVATSCSPSGQARVFVKSGDREVEITNGPTSATVTGSFGD